MAERPAGALFSEADIGTAQNGGKETCIVTAGAGKQRAQSRGGEITGFMGFQNARYSTQGNPFPGEQTATVVGGNAQPPVPRPDFQSSPSAAGQWNAD